MADLLIRNLDPQDKLTLSVRAAKNGRSQQAEAKHILETALRSEKRDWVSMLRCVAQYDDGAEMQLPERHQARSIDVGGWL